MHHLSNRTIRVGLTAADGPDVKPCALGLSTFRAPLPSNCRRLGRYAHVFAILAQYTSLNYTFVRLDGHTYGSIVEEQAESRLDGAPQFDGYIGRLQDGHIDLLVGSITSVPVREEHFTFLRPIAHMTGALLILDARGNTLADRLLAMTTQLRPVVWLAFAIFYVLLTILRQWTRVLYSTTPKLLLTLAWILLTMHFINMYKLMLTSTYLRRPTREITTMTEAIDEAIGTDKIWIVQARNGLTHSFLRNSQHPKMVRLRQKMTKIIFYKENSTICDQMLLANQAYYISIDKNDQFDLERDHCQLKSIPVDVTSEAISFNTFLARKNDSDLVQILNHAMDELRISTILPDLEEVYFRDIIYRRHQCQTLHKQEQKMLSGVQIDSFLGPILATFVSIAVSIAVLFAELWYTRTF